MFRKGLNPLIATFIFIGIIVMIGILMLNLVEPVQEGCSSVSLKIDRDFCIEGTKTIVKLENKGVEITGFMFYVLQDNVELYSQSLKGLEVESKNTYGLSNVPSGPIILIPQIDEDQKLCPTKKLEAMSIKKC